MGTLAYGTVEDTCLLRLVLPACLPACLPAYLPASRNPWENGGQMQTLPGLAHHCCQQPAEAAGPCLSYKRAPGTLHCHTMFSDWEIVPWAHCTETAPLPHPPIPQIGVVLCSSLSSQCPGPPDRTITTPLPLQSVSGSTHISQRTDGGKGGVQ